MEIASFFTVLSKNSCIFIPHQKPPRQSLIQRQISAPEEIEEEPMEEAENVMEEEEEEEEEVEVIKKN